MTAVTINTVVDEFGGNAKSRSRYKHREGKGYQYIIGQTPVSTAILYQVLSCFFVEMDVVAAAVSPNLKASAKGPAYRPRVGVTCPYMDFALFFIFA